MTSFDLYNLPFPAIDIYGWGHGNVIVYPQLFVLPLRLLIADKIAYDFVIEDIKVGQNSRIAACGDISAGVFSDRKRATERSYPNPCIGVVRPGFSICLSVMNLNPGSRCFRAHLECLTGANAEVLEEQWQRLITPVATPVIPVASLFSYSCKCGARWQSAKETSLCYCGEEGKRE